MPNNFSLATAVTFNITPVDGAIFGGEALDRFNSALGLLNDIDGVKNVHADVKEKRVYLAMEVADDINFKKFMGNVRSTIKIIGDHGPDSDILALLLDRHPELKHHPKVNRLVGAFGNLTRVLAELENDSTLSTKLEREHAQRTGTDGVANEKAFDGKKTSSGVKDREEHRRMAMQGQNPDQPAALGEQKIKAPVIPKGYTDGNVFGG